MPGEGHTHRAEELCEPGRRPYARAPEDGAVTARDAEATPCLLGPGLLSPALIDPERLTEAFEPLMRIGAHTDPAPSVIEMLTGGSLINQAISTALDRGVRIRTLYQHTRRHMPVILARHERLRGDTQARTLDEVPERLIIVDRTAAYVPALDIRIPALVTPLATYVDRLRRLCMNVRTARIHIAGLAAAPGSESRAQLGHLIAHSGILEREGAHP
jgi:hypothetical protein